MEITGKITELLTAQTGSSSRGEWKRQDFILETQEQFPKKVCIENWNDKVDFNVFKTGSIVTVSINIESREFNGKWYTGVKAWKMVPAGSETPSGNSNSGSSNSPIPELPPLADIQMEDDLPF